MITKNDHFPPSLIPLILSKMILNVKRNGKFIYETFNNITMTFPHNSCVVISNNPTFVTDLNREKNIMNANSYKEN